MPTRSSYQDVDIPDVDLWAFIFDRRDRGFSDDKGELLYIGGTDGKLNVGQ